MHVVSLSQGWGIPTVTYNCEFQKLNIIKDALNNHFHS